MPVPTTIVAPLPLLLFSGCLWLNYLPQAATGQLDLLSRGVPVAELSQRPDTPPRLRDLLAHIEPLRSFAREKGLRTSSSFQQYVELDREAAVWVVTASPSRTIRATTWTFPLVGSFPYLGYFNRSGANEFARSLRRQGLDAYVRPAATYSTLGFFSDPFLSTMISRSGDHVGQLADTILHESVHATIHIADQSTFNESLAQFVGVLLARQYLSRHASARDLQAYTLAERRSIAWRNTLRALSAAVTALYTEQPRLLRAVLLQRKTELFAQARQRLDHPRTLNNAAILGFRTYHHNSRHVLDLYRKCGEDFGRFWRTARRVNGQHFDRPQQEDLEQLLGGLECVD